MLIHQLLEFYIYLFIKYLSNAYYIPQVPAPLSGIGGTKKYKTDMISVLVEPTVYLWKPQIPEIYTMNKNDRVQSQDISNDSKAAYKLR